MMIKELIQKFIKWRFKCTHNFYTIIYTDYQNRCLECKCLHCKEIFYIGMDQE